MRRSGINRLLPIFVIASGVILIGIAIVYGLTSGSNTSAATATPPLETGDVPRISIDEAKAAYDSGDAIFVDVRDAGSYNAGHIPGALSIPLAELPDRLDDLSRESLILTY